MLKSACINIKVWMLIEIFGWFSNRKLKREWLVSDASKTPWDYLTFTLLVTSVCMFAAWLTWDWMYFDFHMIITVTRLLLPRAIIVPYNSTFTVSPSTKRVIVWYFEWLTGNINWRFGLLNNIGSRSTNESNSKTS